jgi:hypothetical protein
LRHFSSLKYNESNGSPSYPILTYGLLFASTLISSCCGCYNDHITKASKASLHILNIWLYTAGFLINIIFFVLKSAVKDDEPGLFDGYDGWGLGVLICNSLIGIAITAVYKVSFFICNNLVWRRHHQMLCSIDFDCYSPSHLVPIS